MCFPEGRSDNLVRLEYRCNRKDFQAESEAWKEDFEKHENPAREMRIPNIGPYMGRIGDPRDTELEGCEGKYYGHVISNYLYMREDPADGCPGSYINSEFARSLAKYRRHISDTGIVNNNYLLQTTKKRLVHAAIEYYETEFMRCSQYIREKAEEIQKRNATQKVR